MSKRRCLWETGAKSNDNYNSNKGMSTTLLLLILVLGWEERWKE